MRASIEALDILNQFERLVTHSADIIVVKLATVSFHDDDVVK